MALLVPAPIEAVIREADASCAPLDEITFGGFIRSAAPDLSGISEAERRGAYAEWAAWNFLRPHGISNFGQDPWGIYWSPLATFRTEDGRAVHRPDIDEVDDEILRHWIDRVAHLSHPAIKARYADLAWEVGRYLKLPAQARDSQKPPVSIALPVALSQAAIDGYLDALSRDLAEDEFTGWAYIARALVLSISLSDKPRVLKAKDALFAYSRKQTTSGRKFAWARLNDLTEDRAKLIELSESERAEVLQALEDALKLHADTTDKDNFDPHHATDAADRLVKRLGNKPEEIRRVVKVAGAAFEHAAAAQASSTLAIAWLEDLIPRYRNAGLTEDAARVEKAIQERAKQARTELKQISATTSIPKEEIDKWIELVLGDKLHDAFGRIGWLCTTRKENAERSVRNLAKSAPLQAMMDATLVGHDGFTQATIGPVDDDLEGRAIHHAAQTLSFKAWLLNLAFVRAKERYGFTVDDLLSYLRLAPFFVEAREPLLREGLAAWFANDAVKAIHVLVPQVEAACRELLAALGPSVRKYDPAVNGFRVIGMGEVLNHDGFKNGVPPDIRFQLVALYSDPRGINLRNHVAHGIAHPGLLSMELANWVVHSLLLLATLRIKRSSEGGTGSSTHPPDAGGTDA